MILVFAVWAVWSYFEHSKGREGPIPTPKELAPSKLNSSQQSLTSPPPAHGSIFARWRHHVKKDIESPGEEANSKRLEFPQQALRNPVKEVNFSATKYLGPSSEGSASAQRDPKPNEDELEHSQRRQRSENDNEDEVDVEDELEMKKKRMLK
jgi:hypothetical protein